MQEEKPGETQNSHWQNQQEGIIVAPATVPHNSIIVCWCIRKERVCCNWFIKAIYIGCWEPSLDMLPHRQSWWSSKDLGYVTARVRKMRLVDNQPKFGCNFAAFSFCCAVTLTLWTFLSCLWSSISNLIDRQSWSISCSQSKKILSPNVGQSLISIDEVIFWGIWKVSLPIHCTCHQLSLVPMTCTTSLSAGHLISM